MTHRYVKIGATVAVLVLAFVGLMYATLREGTEYYKHVDEVMSTRQTWEGRRLQLDWSLCPCLQPERSGRPPQCSSG